MKKIIFILTFLTSLFLVIPVRAEPLFETELTITMGDDGKIGLDEQDNGGEAKNKAWNEFFGKYKAFIVGCSGFITLTFVLLFIICLLKLGKPGDVRSRKEAVISCLFTGIGSAIFGAATTIFLLFFFAFR